MKVYFVIKDPFPNGMAATNRIKCYARAIKYGGVDNEVIICGSTEIKGEHIRNTEKEGFYEGIKFHYIGGSPVGSSIKIIRHISQYLRIIRTKLYLYKNIRKGDVLFLFMGGHVYLMLDFMRIAHKKGAYCIRDLCELPYGTGIETKKSIHLRNITFNTQFPLLDGIISISDELLCLAKVYSAPFCKHIKVPILVDYDDFFLPDKSSSAEIPYVFHSGTLYQQKDGILGMIEAFGIAVKETGISARFILTGFLNMSPHINEILDTISQYNLEDKVIFTGYLSKEELKTYLSKASMVIINKYNTQQNRYCFSTKLGEYLAAAKPVIITKVGEAMNWLTNGESAYIVEPGDIKALSDVICHVLLFPEEARQVGLNGQYVCRKNFDYRCWGEQLVTFLNELGK